MCALTHTHTHPVYNVLPVTESNFTNISHSLPVQLLRSLLLLRCLQPASLIRPHCVSCRRSAALMYLGDVAAGSKETLQKSIFSSSPEISFNVVSHVFDNKKVIFVILLTTSLTLLFLPIVTQAQVSSG